MLLLDNSINHLSAQLFSRLNILPQHIVDSLLTRAELQGKWVGQLAVDDDVLSDTELAQAIARELKIPLIDLAGITPDARALCCLDEETCRRYAIIPVELRGHILTVAVFNPLDPEAAEQLSHINDCTVTPRVAPLTMIRKAIDDWFRLPAIAQDDDALALLPVSQENAVAQYRSGVHLDQLLHAMLDSQASDLHLTVGSPPLARVFGLLEPLPFPVLDAQTAQQLIYSFLPEKLITRFERENELDTEHSLPGTARFRVSVFRQRGEICAVFRAIPCQVPTLDGLDMPKIIRTLALRPRGLVLVTGPAGVGKTTTLAAMIHEINQARRGHIITVEDPVEFVHANIGCIVNQRQIGRDTATFGRALRHVLRQDPDVILIGEIRDLETVSAAITAAETGHLVLSSLHTKSAAQTIDRIIDFFPDQRQGEVRSQLANILEGIVTQVLIRDKGGRGRSCAQEIMIANDAIRNLIREGKIHQITSVIQAGAKSGMQTMEQALKTLVLEKKIDPADAARYAYDIEEFRKLVTVA
ncbi:MAG TPA: PilT/PilU family type 4a pilus ATPase [Armatimonadota bacterium]|jgi:twitching motility protein PilT